MVGLLVTRFIFVFITNQILEKPRFINLSSSLQIAPHYSTVNFICQIYGVPSPVVTWYKILEKTKQDLELLAINSQQYVYSYRST
jgi:hypothetical protein